eukprot:1116817-Rhodomonas_salina.5
MGIIALIKGRMLDAENTFKRSNELVNHVIVPRNQSLLHPESKYTKLQSHDGLSPSVVEYESTSTDMPYGAIRSSMSGTDAAYGTPRCLVTKSFWGDKHPELVEALQGRAESLVHRTQYQEAMELFEQLLTKRMLLPGSRAHQQRLGSTLAMILRVPYAMSCTDMPTG